MWMEKIQARRTNGFWQTSAAQWLDKKSAYELAEILDIPCPRIISDGAHPRDLPEVDPGVYKANRGYAGKRVVVYSGGRDLIRGCETSIAEIRDYLANEDTQGPAGGFFVEEFLSLRGGPANDVKVYSFNGINALIHYKNHATGLFSCVSPDWHPLPVVYPKFSGWNEAKYMPPKPIGLEDALDWASRVTDELGTFLRVDFLETDRGCLLGELTATPSGGKGFSEEVSDWLDAFWRFAGITI